MSDETNFSSPIPSTSAIWLAVLYRKVILLRQTATKNGIENRQ
jgi:hypothetical protein